MKFSDTFMGKVLITGIGGILSTILGILVILFFSYLFAKYGVIPYLIEHLNIPDWLIEVLGKVV